MNCNPADVIFPRLWRFAVFFQSCTFVVQLLPRNSYKLNCFRSASAHPMGVCVSKCVSLQFRFIFQNERMLGVVIKTSFGVEVNDRIFLAEQLVGS